MNELSLGVELRVVASSALRLPLSGLNREVKPVATATIIGN